MNPAAGGVTTDGTYMATIYRLEAVNFWKSAKTLSASVETNMDASPGNIGAIPFYLLISHAAELLLKSGLLKRRFTENDLKKFGYRHSLIALMEELQGKGVSVSSESVSLIRGLDSQHHNHALRYTALVDDGASSILGICDAQRTVVVDTNFYTRSMNA